MCEEQWAAAEVWFTQVSHIVGQWVTEALTWANENSPAAIAVGLIVTLWVLLLTLLLRSTSTYTFKATPPKRSKVCSETPKPPPAPPKPPDPIPLAQAISLRYTPSDPPMFYYRETKTTEPCRTPAPVVQQTTFVPEKVPVKKGPKVKLPCSVTEEDGEVTAITFKGKLSCDVYDDSNGGIFTALKMDGRDIGRDILWCSGQLEAAEDGDELEIAEVRLVVEVVKKS